MAQSNEEREISEQSNLNAEHLASEQHLTEEHRASEQHFAAEHAIPAAETSTRPGPKDIIMDNKEVTNSQQQQQAARQEAERKAAQEAIAQKEAAAEAAERQGAVGVGYKETVPPGLAEQDAAIARQAALRQETVRQGAVRQETAQPEYWGGMPLTYKEAEHKEAVVAHKDAVHHEEVAHAQKEETEATRQEQAKKAATERKDEVTEKEASVRKKEAIAIAEKKETVAKTDAEKKAEPKKEAEKEAAEKKAIAKKEALAEKKEAAKKEVIAGAAKKEAIAEKKVASAVAEKKEAAAEKQAAEKKEANAKTDGEKKEALAEKKEAEKKEANATKKEAEAVAEKKEANAEKQEKLDKLDKEGNLGLAGVTLLPISGTFPIQYASKISNINPNAQGDSVSVTCAGGETLVAIAIGLKTAAPFDLLHGSNGAPPWSGNLTMGINDYNSNPAISDGSSENGVITNITEAITTNVVTLTVAAGDWASGMKVTLAGLTVGTWLNGKTVTLGSSTTTTSLVFVDPTGHGAQTSTAETGTATETGGNVWTLGAYINTFNSDYTPSATPPTAPNPYPSVGWNLDGYFPSIYIWTACVAQAGTYNVTLNSMFTNNATANWQIGRPIFNGGVNFQVVKFGGTAMAGAAFNIGTPSTSGSSTTNPATGTQITTTGAGMVLAVALQKSANGLGLGPVDGTLTNQYSLISSGKLVGSEAHYMIQWGVQTGAGGWQPKFANPLGYETLVAGVSITP